MFCENCGTQIVDGNAFCQTCGTAAGQQQVAPPQPETEQVGGAQANIADGQAVAADIAGKAKVASQDAWQAIQQFTINPIGGLEPAYRNLDAQRVWGVIAVIAIINTVCAWFVSRNLADQSILGIFGLFVQSDYQPPNIILTVIYGLVGIAAFAGIIAIVRLLFRGKGSFDGDCFVAAAALLPVSIAALISVILGSANTEILVALFTFAVCYTILILFAGYTRIAKIVDGKAALAVPVVLLIAHYAIKVVIAS